MSLVLGAAATEQGPRIGSVGDLARRAALAALADANLSPAQIGCVVMGNALAGDLADQSCVRGNVWLHDVGLRGPIINVDSSCASGSSALWTGDKLARAGEGPVLVVAAEQMWVADRNAAVDAIAQGFDPDTRRDATALAAGHGTATMYLNARWAEQVLADHDNDLLGIAEAAVKAHRLADLNPSVRSRPALTAEQVLAAPVINAPLTRPMCSSMVDCGAAVVLDSDTAPGLRQGIRLRTCVGIAGDGSIDYHDRLQQGCDALWEAAGLAPTDLDLMELHDATAAEEIWASEIAGIVPAGQGIVALRAGDTLPGGRGVAVNPSGGLVGRGHPIGATGLDQIVELVIQLRGHAAGRQVPHARLGAAVNTGGIMNTDAMSLYASVLETFDRTASAE